MGIWRSAARAAAALALLVLVPACGSSGDGGSLTVSLFAGSLQLTADGGRATGGSGPSVDGGNGGQVRMYTAGSLWAGINPAPLAPPLPTPPTIGLVMPNGVLANTSTVPNGNMILSGDYSLSAVGSHTLICDEGDIVLSGTVVSAKLNGFSSYSNLTLQAPSGTVYITGSLRMGRVQAVPTGLAGGILSVNAQRIVFTGTIDARGEDNPNGNGGRAGFLSFNTPTTASTGMLLVGGTFDGRGGAGQGVGVSGGQGGTVEFSPAGLGPSNGELRLHGTTLRLNGGDARGSGANLGGNGGTVFASLTAGVTLNGTIESNGGAAESSTSTATGGDAGSLLIGSDGGGGAVTLYGSLSISGGSALSSNAAAAVKGGNGGSLIGFWVVSGASNIDLGAGALRLRGGDSSGSAGRGGLAEFRAQFDKTGEILYAGDVDVSDGNGSADVNDVSAGTITFYADQGDIRLSGTFAARGGRGSSAVLTEGPNAGGVITVQTGDGENADAGSITLDGTIDVSGGSAATSSSNNHGGAGGFVDLHVDNFTGSITLEPGSRILANGGSAAGTAAAQGGSGGLITLHTSTYAITMAGLIEARGGSGIAAGGEGGLVSVSSDDLLGGTGAGDGTGGDITLAPGATIDASGGPGAPGGNANAASIHVVFDADGNNSNSAASNGRVLNLGTILVRGASANGNGGRVVFDGLNAAGAVGPAAGTQDRSASGTGTAGTFISQ